MVGDGRDEGLEKTVAVGLGEDWRSYCSHAEEVKHSPGRDWRAGKLELSAGATDVCPGEGWGLGCLCIFSMAHLLKGQTVTVVQQGKSLLITRVVGYY